MEEASEQGEPEPDAESGEGQAPAPNPWPDKDPAAIETKSFMVGGDVPGGRVAVTIRDGNVAKTGAPDDLFSRVVQAAGNALTDIGSLIKRPYVVRADAFASMTIVFGEPVEESSQLEIPTAPPVWVAAARIGEMIGLDEEQLFEFAVEIGTGAAAYVELTRLVESEGITLDWETRTLEPQRLDPERAARQFKRLTPEPQLRDRTIDVDGLLYRVIYDGKGEGRAGIRLSKASARPPQHRGRLLIVRYESEDIEDQIIHNLIGQSVTATIRITEWTPGTSIVKPELPYPLIEKIVAGGHYDPDELFDEEDEFGPAFRRPTS